LFVMDRELHLHLRDEPAELLRRLARDEQRTMTAVVHRALAVYADRQTEQQPAA
jgi:predicted transcriptional regulator